MEQLENNFEFNGKIDDISYKTINFSLKEGKFERSSIFRNSFNKFNIRTFKFSGNRNPSLLAGGIPLGRANSMQTLIDNSDAHTLVIGATGSKKSRLVIMPSVYIMGSAGESMIVSDPKAEIYGRTSSYLKRMGYNLVVVNLRNPDTGRAWNPLAIPYSFYKNGDIDRAYEFANDVAFNLTQVEKDLSDPFWDNSAGDLFFGLVALLFKYNLENNLPDEYVNLYNLLRLRRYLFRDVENSKVDDPYLRDLIDNDEIITGSLSGTITAPEKTKTSILSTFDEKMRCFILQTNLLDMLSNNDIDIKNSSKNKFAIFLIIPDEKTTYHKLVSLFIKQSYEYLIYEAQMKQAGRLPIRVNYILDEFSSLPTIKDFPNMVSAARSRDIRFVLVIQSKHQLVERYREESETIISNCINWIFLTSRELPLLTDLSILCGKNKSGRDILSISALQHLNKEKGQALILSGRLLPYIAELIDISEYDQDKYSSLQLKATKREKFLLQNFKKIEEDSNEYVTSVVQNHVNNDDVYEKDLKKPFKKLFGPFSEED